MGKLQITYMCIKARLLHLWSCIFWIN